MNHRLLTYAFAITAATSSFAQHTHVMDVNTKKAGATVQNTMYGLFFEDINYAADGGLYGELVKNRSFEFPQSFMGWQTFGNVELKADGPFERCPHYVVLSDPQHVERRTGLVNEGPQSLRPHHRTAYQPGHDGRTPGFRFCQTRREIGRMAEI